MSEPKENNPENPQPIRKPDDDSGGQNPAWPGEDIRFPKPADGEEIIPLVR